MKTQGPISPQKVAKDQAVRFALSMGKPKPVPHFAGGGVVGPLLDAGPGRTDSLPISVPPGSYVLPADIVSGMPGAQGNSLAGHVALNKLLQAIPLLPDEAPYGADKIKMARASTIPGLSNTHHIMRSELDKAKGGKVPHDHGQPIDILAAGGEHIIEPEIVRRIGLGNMERGHAILDEFVKQVRKRNIEELRKLPGPVKDGSK
jgi:hypothetical protein